MTQPCHWIACGAWIGAALLGGCAEQQNSELQARMEPQTSMERPHPMLVAAGTQGIRFFGELPDGGGPDYFTRSAGSLRKHTFTEIGDDYDPDLDPAGQRLVFASTRHSAQPDLYVKSVEGVAVTQLTSDPAADVQPALSPDGQRVAFASRRGGQWDIWVIAADGGQPIQVTSSAADEMHPSWSPDGTRLVYCRLPETGGQWELWIVRAQSGGTQKFIGYGLFPEWSPTDDRIVFQRARERGSRWFSIWTLTLVNGEPRYPTELASSNHEALILPTFSPDGQWVAFTSTGGPTGQGEGTASSDIWMMRADGRGKIRLTDGHTANFAPVFSQDGRVYFTSNRTGHENVWSQLPSGPERPDITTTNAQPNPTGDAVGQAPGTPARTVSGKSASAVGWNSGVSDKRTSSN